MAEFDLVLPIQCISGKKLLQNQWLSAPPPNAIYSLCCPECPRHSAVQATNLPAKISANIGPGFRSTTVMHGYATV